jgi:hypothetical protein
MEQNARIVAAIKDLKKLYGISEAEESCMMQMLFMIKMLGYSPELTIKLLRALTAMMEIIQDEMPKEKP